MKRLCIVLALVLGLVLGSAPPSRAAVGVNYVTLDGSFQLQKLATNLFSANTNLLVTALTPFYQQINPAITDFAGISASQGDVLYYNGTHWVRLAAGTSGYFLKTLGAGANPAWASIPGGGDALTSNPLSQFAATTSLQLAGVISDETGSGALVFANSPSLAAPALGTPVSGNFSSGSFTWPTFNQNTTGSAATLTTPRTIGGSSFDGSGNIASFPSPGAIGGTTPAAGTFTTLISKNQQRNDVNLGNITGSVTVSYATNVIEFTMTGNVALTLSGSAPTSGFLWPGGLVVHQDATGSRTLTVNGTSVTVNGTASSVTGVSVWTTDGGTTLHISSDYSSAGGLADPGSNGMLSRTSSGTTTPRTITGTANEVSVANGDGVSGNPTISLPSTLTLTGKAVTVANQTAGNNSTAAANTAYVDARVLAPSFTTLTDGATITWTVNSLYAVQNGTVTLAGNRTLAFSGIAAGMTGVLIVKQDATGSRTLALPAGSKVINGGSGAITLTTTASAIDVLTWFYDGTNYFWTYGKNYN